MYLVALFIIFILLSLLALAFLLRPLGWTNKKRAILLSGFFIALVVFSFGYFHTIHQGLGIKWIAQQNKITKLLQPVLLHKDYQQLASLMDIYDETTVIMILQRQLQQNPNRYPFGWLFLARIYLISQEISLAQDAIKHAFRLIPGDEQVLIAYAQVLFLLDGQTNKNQSSQLLLKLLKQQPKHEDALMLLGMVSFELGDFSLALTSWQQLLAQRVASGVDQKQQSYQVLSQSILAAQQRLSEVNKKTTDTDATAVTSATQIRVNIKPSEDMGENINLSKAVLFVFAKTQLEQPMPFAAVKVSLTQWPMKVIIDESNVLLSHQRLSEVEALYIQARISTHDNPMVQVGDWQSKPQYIEIIPNKENKITLLIDEIIK